MKTITIRDLRQRWPAAERLLQTERELVITRDGQPVARLVRLRSPQAKRSRFNPAQHRAWQRQVFRQGTAMRWVEQTLAAGRRERSSEGRS